MKSLRFLSLIIVLIVLSSCESKTFLRSKKKVDKELQGYWRPLKGTSIYGATAAENDIMWRFADGEVFIIQVDDKGDDHTIDKGRYSLDTKIDDIYMTISGLKTSQYQSYGFNLKWDIIDINNNSFIITGRPNNSGRIEIEFSKTEH